MGESLFVTFVAKLRAVYVLTKNFVYGTKVELLSKCQALLRLGSKRVWRTCWPGWLAGFRNVTNDRGSMNSTNSCHETVVWRALYFFLSGSSYLFNGLWRICAIIHQLLWIRTITSWLQNYAEQNWLMSCLELFVKALMDSHQWMSMRFCNVQDIARPLCLSLVPPPLKKKTAAWSFAAEAELSLQSNRWWQNELKECSDCQIACMYRRNRLLATLLQNNGNDEGMISESPWLWALSIDHEMIKRLNPFVFELSNQFSH